jgi:hypothetical protein
MISMLSDLQDAVPGLVDALNTHVYFTDANRLWQDMHRLLVAHAPSGGAWLRGAIIDDIADIGASLGLQDRFIRHIGATGNTGFWLGAEKDVYDVIVVSHMDRPSFKLKGDGSLYAVCANRFPDGTYTVPAKALRYENGQIGISAKGTLTSVRENGKEDLKLDVTSGEIAWWDTITMDVEPTLVDGVITGTGLDNSLGVLTVLGTVAALKAAEAALIAKNRRVLFVLSDLEEGIPEMYFGHGAARLAYAVPPPTYGCVVADAHTVTPDGPRAGKGVAHGSVSSWSKGSFVAPNYLALGVELAAEANAQQPGTIQMNTGYLSRSDDMVLGRWTQVLGMIGAAMSDAHTGYESAQIADLPRAVWWLSHFTAAVLGMSDEIAAKYLPQVR